MFTQATQEIYRILQKFITFLFSQCDIGGGVTIGYIILSIGLTAIIIGTFSGQIKRSSTNITVRERGGGDKNE